MLTSCIKPVDFIKFHQVCEHETCCNLIFADLLQADETTYIKPACSSQLAASLLTTCNRLVIIKPEQAMRTHPDIGLVIADLLQLARLLVFSRNKVPVQGQQIEDVARNNNRPDTKNKNNNNNNRPFWNDTSNGPPSADKENHVQNQNVSREEYNVSLLMGFLTKILLILPFDFI